MVAEEVLVAELIEMPTPVQVVLAQQDKDTMADSHLAQDGVVRLGAVAQAVQEEMAAVMELRPVKAMAVAVDQDR